MANSEKLSTSLSEAQFLRMRPANFMGSEFPQNIWCKEAIDNCTDIITEGRSTQAKFMIMDDGRSIVQMDNGTGISTRQCLDANGVKSTYLYNSIHKLYAGSNYGDENTTVKQGQDTAGTNGIGFKLITCISKFSITGISKNPVKYSGKTLYIPGLPKAVLKRGTEEELAKDPFARSITIQDEGSDTNLDTKYAENIKDFFKTYPTVSNIPEGYAVTCLYGYAFSEGELITLEDINGNPVKQDPATPSFIQMVVPLVYKNNGYAEGFITLSKLDETVVPDLPDIAWLKPYICEKVRSIKPESEDVFVTFSYPEKDSDGKISRKVVNYARPLDVDKFNKEYKKQIDSGEIEKVVSWEEQVEAVMKRPEAAGQMYRTTFGYFDIVFSKDAALLNELNCIVQGARVLNPKTVNIGVEVGGQKINIPLPCVWKLSIPSKRISVSYTDQTKVKYQSTTKTNPKMSLYSLPTAAMKVPEIKQHVESEANSKFLKKAGKAFQSDFYWPASGGETAREYFMEPFAKNPEYALEVIERLRNDEDAQEYIKKNNLDLDKLAKNYKKADALNSIVEIEMYAQGIKPEKFDQEFKILLIVEGHSASSGIRTARNSKVVGVLALRGKILNVWQKSLADAMKSEIIKELLNVLQDESYAMIISCTDADADGSSITTLLIGCFAKYKKDIIKEGRFFNNLAPLYTFKDIKTRKLVGWSNNKHDCPKGAKIMVNKGLGSYEVPEIKRLILNPSAGAEWEQITYDKNAQKSLTMALQSGGKELFYIQDKKNNFVPFVS